MRRLLVEPLMDQLLVDLRFAARTMLRSPLVTVAAIITLAVGIGANTAMFSVVRGVLLTPLPYEEAERIVRVWPQRPFSKEMAAAFRERVGAFSAFTIFGRIGTLLKTTEGTEEWPGLAVLGDHFAVLGVSATRGRGLTVADELPGAPPVAVVSHDFWQRRFGGSEPIIGRVITLGGIPTEIVGVLPSGFRPLFVGTAVWRPLRIEAANLDDYRDFMVYAAMARLADGVSEEAAVAEVRVVGRALRAELPDYHGEQQVATAGVIALKERLVGNVRGPLTILLAAAGLVLMIACANVAMLLLARITQRRGEIAVRAALGASRRRLVRQLLTESGLLAVCAGAVGAALAWWSEALLVGLLPVSLPRLDNVHIEPYELLFAMGLSVIAVLISGLAPALGGSRGGTSALARAVGQRAGDTRKRSASALVTAEVALAVVLTVGSGLMLKSLWRMMNERAGFDSEHVLSLRLRPPASLAGDATRRVHLQSTLDAVETIPGVEHAALIDLLPMAGGHRGLAFSTPDHPAPADAPPRTAGIRLVSPGYFKTLGIPLLRGRGFGADDRAGSRPVGLINQRLASQLWPDEKVVGKELLWPDGSPWLTVVGVVGDVRQASLDQPSRATIYQSIDQVGDLNQVLASAYLLVRTEGPPMATSVAVAETLRAESPNTTVAQLRPLVDVVRDSADQRRFIAFLLSVFGALAVFLAAVGIYGVGAHAVGARVPEIGIRLALGAGGGAVLRAVLARELRAISIGVLAGLGVAVGAGRLLASQLYAVGTVDGSVLLAALVVIACVALVAILAPARRAVRIDPAIALRSR